MELIEILMETDEESSQKTIPLILPPVIMCSSPQMIKASRREALAALCSPGSDNNGDSINKSQYTNYNDEHQGNLKVSLNDLKVNLSDLMVKVLDVATLNPADAIRSGRRGHQEGHPKVSLEIKVKVIGPKVHENQIAKRLDLQEFPDNQMTQDISLAVQKNELFTLLRDHIGASKIRIPRPVTHHGPGPDRSIQEHCTLRNLSSVQRKYVGLWRDNKRCL